MQKGGSRKLLWFFFLITHFTLPLVTRQSSQGFNYWPKENKKDVIRTREAFLLGKLQSDATLVPIGRNTQLKIPKLGVYVLRGNLISNCVSDFVLQQYHTMLVTKGPQPYKKTLQTHFAVVLGGGGGCLHCVRYANISVSASRSSLKRFPDIVHIPAPLLAQLPPLPGDSALYTRWTCVFVLATRGSPFTCCVRLSPPHPALFHLSFTRSPSRGPKRREITAD